MDRITRFRAGCLLTLFIGILGLFAYKLYDMQVVATAGNTQNVTTFATRTRVRAARGNLLDRNGTMLVTNRASYDLVINHYVLTSAGNTNEALYQLVQLCKQQGIDYVDHLPITTETPFAYTLQEYSAVWQNYFQTFLANRDQLDSDMSATLLIQKLRESYAIPESWSDVEARAVLGLRYELSLRNYVGALSNYVFLADAFIQFYPCPLAQS